MSKNTFTVPFKRGDVYTFLPSDLQLPEYTGRSERSAESINRMALSLVRDGQLQEVGVRRSQGVPVVIFGTTRKLAADKVNSERLVYDAQTDSLVVSNATEFIPIKLRAKYFEVNDQEALLMTFKENDEDTRTPVSAVDIAQGIRFMSDRYGWTDGEIAKKLGKTAAYISQHRKVLELDAETQKALIDGSVKLNVAIGNIAAISPDQRPAVIAKVKADNNGKVTGPAVAKAAGALGVTVAKPLKKTAADFTNWLNETIEGTPVGAAQNFLYAIKDFQAGIISTDDLTESFETLYESPELAFEAAS